MNTTALAEAQVPSEEDAIVAAAVADRSQFALIYQRYRLPVYRYLRARGADDEMAGDLTNVTFERALGSLSGYRPRGGGLRAWLFRIARNAWIDEHRRSGRLASIDPRDLTAAAATDQFGASELRILVAQLPPDARDAIALRYAAGLTAREIGLVLGKRPDAVQKTITRALATLREALDDPR